MFSKDAVLEGVAIVIGAVLAGIGGKYLPAFNYSQIVYGLVGILLVIMAVGWMDQSRRVVSGFVIGLGAGLGTQIFPGITSLTTGGKK